MWKKKRPVYIAILSDHGYTVMFIVFTLSALSCFPMLCLNLDDFTIRTIGYWQFPDCLFVYLKQVMMRKLFLCACFVWWCHDSKHCNFFFFPFLSNNWKTITLSFCAYTLCVGPQPSHAYACFWIVSSWSLSSDLSNNFDWSTFSLGNVFIFQVPVAAVSHYFHKCLNGIF